jgi:hypothetical protein
MAEAPFSYPRDWHLPHGRHEILVRRIARTIGRKFHTKLRNRIDGIQNELKSLASLSIDANWCTLLPAFAVGGSSRSPRREKASHDMRHSVLDWVCHPIRFSSTSGRHSEGS